MNLLEKAVKIIQFVAVAVASYKTVKTAIEEEKKKRERKSNIS